MKTPSQDLYLLLRAMSQEERRRYQLDKPYKPQNDDSPSQKLFKRMQAQTQYDEAALKRAFPDLSANAFAALKRQLQQQVENFLTRFYQTRSGQGELWFEIEKADILRSRGLYARCMQILKSLREKAEKYDRLLVLLEVNRIERSIVKEFVDRDPVMQLEKLFQEQRRLKQQLEQLDELRITYDLVSVALRVGKWEAHFEREEWEELLRTPLLRQLQEPGSFNIARMYHMTRAFLFQITQQYPAYRAEMQLLHAVWKAHPHQIADQVRAYKIFLSNLLNALQLNGDFSEFDTVIAAWEAIPAQNEDERAEDFQNLFFYRQLQALNSGDFLHIEALDAGLRAGLKQYAQKVNQARVLSLAYNQFTGFLMLNRYLAARYWLDEILNRGSSEHRQDIQETARMLEVVLYIQKPDPDMAENRLHACREWLRTHHALHPFNQVVVSHLARILKAAGPARVQACMQMQAALRELAPEHLPRQGHQELLHWLEQQHSARG